MGRKRIKANPSLFPVIPRTQLDWRRRDPDSSPEAAQALEAVTRAVNDALTRGFAFKYKSLDTVLDMVEPWADRLTLRASILHDAAPAPGTEYAVVFIPTDGRHVEHRHYLLPPATVGELGVRIVAVALDAAEYDLLATEGFGALYRRPETARGRARGEGPLLRVRGVGAMTDDLEVRYAAMAASRAKLDAKYADVASFDRAAFWEARFAKVYRQAKRAAAKAKQRGQDHRARGLATLADRLNGRLPATLLQLLRPAAVRELSDLIRTAYAGAAVDKDGATVGHVRTADEFGKRLTGWLLMIAADDRAVDDVLRTEERRARDATVPRARRFNPGISQDNG